MPKFLILGSAILLAALLCALPIFLFDGQKALAQTGASCDGDRVVATCSAAAQVDGRWLILSSSHHECSRVDWLRDGQPQTAVFRGGEERIELLGQPPRTIEVQSCSVIETLDEAGYDSDTNTNVRPAVRPIKCLGEFPDGRQIRASATVPYYDTAAEHRAICDRLLREKVRELNRSKEQ